MKRTRLYLHPKAPAAPLMVLVFLTFGPLPNAEVGTIDNEVNAHEFLIGVGDAARPVVGVQKQNRVYVLNRDKTRDVVSPDPQSLQVVDKKMAPAGRLTICETRGRSERETRIDTDIVAEIVGRELQYELGETVFTFDVVADRPMQGVYVALFLYHPERPDNVAVDFGNIGDLPMGEVVSREIFFPNTTVAEGMEYRFEFFTDGAPLEMYMLNQVACNPASRSLHIPWESRLQCYLNTGHQQKMTGHPRPWRMGIEEMDLDTYRARGPKDLQLKIRVKADGNVELMEGDPRLTPGELADLRTDISQWQFFPEMEKGNPRDKLVAVPLKL